LILVILLSAQQFKQCVWIIVVEGVSCTKVFPADYFRCRLLPPAHDCAQGLEAGKSASWQIPQCQDCRFWYSWISFNIISFSSVQFFFI